MIVRNGTRLRLKERSDHYEFVCPNCGDMRFPNKRKAWIYKDTWKYICFKCPCSMPFAYYLKQTDREAYKRLIYAAFGEMGHEGTRKEKPKEERVELSPELPFVDGELLPITVDNDIKLMIAAEQGIEISVEELERVNEQVKKGELNFDIPRPQPQIDPDDDEDAKFNAMMDMVAEDDEDE